MKTSIQSVLTSIGYDETPTIVNELVYRYLLTKGDALGGKSRNLAGILGERKFIRFLVSIFKNK